MVFFFFFLVKIKFQINVYKKPLSIAIKINNTEIINLLKDKGAKQ